MLPSDRLAPNGPGVRLVACTGCGTLESVPPEGLSSVAGDSTHYLPHETPGGLRGWLAARSQERKASVVMPWAGGDGVVDLGCGSGGFLDAWRRSFPGEEAIGIESSERAIGEARARGIEIVQSSLDDPIPEAVRGRTLYTMWHVIEHLEDPVTTLINVRDGMDPAGRIVLVVPNAAGLERSLFGAKTVAWDPPRHIWHFTPEGLTALAARTGLRVLHRFNLISDDVYDAVASLQWVLYPRAWVDSGSFRGMVAAGLAVAGGVPTGLALAALTPWRQRASLGVVTARDD